MGTKELFNGPLKYTPNGISFALITCKKKAYLVE